jgi:hypothetical protein
MIKLFLARNTSRIPGFPGIFCSIFGKYPHKAEVFLIGKSKVS